MPLSEDDLDRKPDKKRPKGNLPYLPDRNAPLSDWRAWVTRAFGPPDGYEFDSFIRHGKESLSNPAVVVFTTPVGGEVRWRFPEQRALAKTSNVRASVVSVTDGLCRMPPLNANEASDVWVALCTLAHNVAQHDEVAEFREKLDTFQRLADVERRYTLHPSGRFDALVALQARGLFEARHARLVATESDEAKWSRRPVVLVDSHDKVRWIRVPELATYLRHVVGERLGHGMLDGLMSEIGADRIYHEVRNGAAHPHGNFYRLPPDSEDEDGWREQIPT
jgi:hypothetical protein